MGMPPWIQVPGMAHILSPLNALWILRTCHDEAQSRSTPGDVIQPCIDPGLSVGSVRSHIAHIARESLGSLPSEVTIWIDGAKQRLCAARSEISDKLHEKRSRRETEVDIQFGYLRCSDV